MKKVTFGPKHHFFGYYDKTPWDKTGRYMLGLETKFMDHPPGADDVTIIGLIDTENDNRWKPVAETKAWNWQQGTMLRWMPNAPEGLIVYNSREKDRFISHIRNVFTGESKQLPLPVYAVSNDGKLALSINFARIHRMRPGYGYAGLPDFWEDELAPADDGIYLMNIETGEYKLIISIKQIAEFKHKDSMDGCKHYFNHLLFNLDNSRFLFLHRWYSPALESFPRETRLLTANPDGSDICCLADDEMVSHFDWKSPEQILAWARQKKIGDRYFSFTDHSDKIEVVGEGVLTSDGHCSYSPDRKYILTDTYPDSKQMRTLILYRIADGKRMDIGNFFSPPELTGEIRCDLHPRWNRDGKQICMDSVHEGSRQMYLLDVSQIVGK